MGALAHAVFTALFWIGPVMYAALGLGFKDRSTWTWLDSAIANWAMPLANILTTPGRSLTYDGLGGFTLPAVLTSATWGIGIATAVCCVRRWRQRDVKRLRQ
ncbi:hypothetical protein BOTU111922_08860 [Bordetella tumulicola]